MRLLRTLCLFLIFYPCGRGAAQPATAGPRTVFLLGELSAEQRIAVPAQLAGSSRPSAVLLDAPAARDRLKEFIAAYQPDRLVPVGAWPGGTAGLEAALGMKPAPVLACDGVPSALQQTLWRQARTVVVAPAQPRRLLMHAACLAGALRAPLLVGPDKTELGRALAHWQCQEVYAVGDTQMKGRSQPGPRVVSLPDEQSVTQACLAHQLRQGPLDALVVANPADVAGAGAPGSPAGLSALAPWVAIRRHAALLLTNEQGNNVGEVVGRACRRPELHRADAVILVGDSRALPTRRRPNPVPGGKDAQIEMEPLTPRGHEPHSFAVGRLCHREPAVVMLLVERPRLLDRERPGHALVVGNPGGGLPLLEALSRSAVLELRNGGYQTTARFGDEVRRDELRRLLPRQDLFLWEGHHSTFARDLGVPRWPEPLRPSLFFLQSCLALTDEEAGALLQRGAVGVIGTSTRTYAGSGGAIALAFIDALVYERQSLGGALRHAKNFMLAFSLLKEKRLADRTASAGASLRAAWAFTLWGDPTVQLPPAAAAAVQQVRYHLDGQNLVVSLPGQKHPRVQTAGYHAEVPPKVLLAGLHGKDEGQGHRLVPLVFVEVPLQGPPGAVPRLKGRLRSDRWVFLWDGRRGCGYLLAQPRSTDEGELRFQVSW